MAAPSRPAMVYVLDMFSLVVIAVAIAVIGMYVRHDLQMRRKRRAELARGDSPPPTNGPS